LPMEQAGRKRKMFLNIDKIMEKPSLQ